MSAGNPEVAAMAAKATSVQKRVAKALDRLAEGFEIDSGDSKNFDKMLRARDLDPKNKGHVRAVAVTIWGAVFEPGSSGREPKWTFAFRRHRFQRDYWEVRNLPGIATADAAYEIMRTEQPWCEEYGALKIGTFRKLMSDVRRDPMIKLISDDKGGWNWSVFQEALKQLALNHRLAAPHLSEEDWNRECQDKFVAAKRIVEAFGVNFSPPPIPIQTPYPKRKAKVRKSAARSKKRARR
jgi:hypothetical protein